MKRHRICVVVFIALSWLSGPYLWAAPLYDLVDLGLFLTMTAINRHGTMTGSTWQYTEHLMMARGTDVTDLGGLGGAYAIGSAIAPGGTIVGFGESVAAGLHTRAFMWTAATGILQELPVTELTLNSSAWGVNDAGVIVGGEAISEAPGSPVIAQSLPVRWVNGAVEILPGGSGVAKAVNASGLMGGQIGSTAVFWHPDGTMESLGLDGAVEALNDRTQALIGQSSALFRWQDGQATPLAFPSDGFSTSLSCGAGGMNLLGWIVASCTRDPAVDGTDSHGILWQNTTPVDVNTVIEAPGYIVTEANGVNDFGMIVGSAMAGGQVHGVLLVPKALQKFPGLMDWLGL